MRYLLDTCVISELVKKKPHSGVIRWIKGNDEEQLYLSVLTLGEIQKGISRLADAKRRDRIQHWLDMEMVPRFTGRIIPVSDDIALTWGMILGEAEGEGTPLPVIDALLAATAISHNLTLVTRNEKDIAPTGVHHINPWNL